MQTGIFCGTHSVAQGPQICHCEEAAGRRGALSAQREEVPLGCNLAGSGWITGQLRRIRKLVREIATGAKRPRNDNSGVHTILTMACTDRQHCAGPGCPLPYNARVAALKKQAQGSTSLRHYFSVCFTASAAPAWPSAERAGLLPDRSRLRRPAPSGRGRSRRGSEFPVRACRTSRRARRRTEDDAPPRS